MSPGKRAFDLVVASVGLVLAAPVLCVVAIAVRAEDGGPVFYRQQRIGRGGRPFRIWKFRSMRPAAPTTAGLPLTVGRDPRVTRVGRLLRRWRLDELPQLFNVLAGEMSLVGPRPEVPRYVAHYTPEQRRVLELVPGVTDPAAIAGRDESDLLAAAADPEAVYLRELLPRKVALQRAYAEDATRWSDLRVLAATLRAVFGPAARSTTREPARRVS
ncbi:MAG TPA: sugar transferase [Longimicrobiales bacterium]|nr:sugar transferase [Longimicrobiales bacterium]